MTNYRDQAIRAEVFIASTSEEDERNASEMLGSVVAGRDLDAFLRTIAADITDTVDTGNESVEYQLSLAERLNDGRTIPQAVQEGLRKGEFTCITSPSQLANLAIYAVANRHWSGIARPASMLRILTLLNFCSLRDPLTDNFYIDPTSVPAAFAVATSHVDRFYSVLHREVRRRAESLLQPGCG